MTREAVTPEAMLIAPQIVLMNAVPRIKLEAGPANARPVPSSGLRMNCAALSFFTASMLLGCSRGDTIDIPQPADDIPVIEVTEAQLDSAPEIELVERFTTANKPNTEFSSIPDIAVLRRGRIDERKCATRVDLSRLIAV